VIQSFTVIFFVLSARSYIFFSSWLFWKITLTLPLCSDSVLVEYNKIAFPHEDV